MNAEIATWRDPQGRTITLVQGDITEERVDAIVNAANSHLRHGGGVAAAIARKGGPAIQQESDRIGFVEVGGAAVTGAGRLPCRYVIHAVGPMWGAGGEDAKLGSAARGSLARAEQLGLASVSLPAISSGIFGFPKERCAEILLTEARRHFAEGADTRLRTIRFCLFDEPTVRAFREAWDRAMQGGD
ncbi:MAG: macro domain-containing protein [Chthonomonadales bacterium]|nr:macro domain-containing protein [Chthonomonadales bacterium]